MQSQNGDDNILKFRRRFSEKNRAEMHAILDQCIQKAMRGAARLKVAQVKGTYEKHPQMHYHFNPEIFIQLEGSTEFAFPREQLTLQPGEICIVPSGVPHREQVAARGGRFRNLVIACYENAVSVHFATEVAPGKPDIEAIETFNAPDIHQIEDLANLLIQAFHSATPARDSAVRGLLIAYFSIVRNLVDMGNEVYSSESGKVFQAKCLVREQISNSELSVKTLAEKLQCSADYLSHLFHRETGEKLIQYIQRTRIESARLALEATSLYISEIAWSSGFADPAYFARVFRKFTGESPQSYRDKLEQARQETDRRPKTVYHDREDFTRGRPRQVAAAL
ncbi:MAG: AraC family transcriptional regulator [Puniceicoccaceae bacterium 5H]|nr:MAG: AraC family transcriptional regulator [Puniceicoccaceae bacterium 5H]